MSNNTSTNVPAPRAQTHPALTAYRVTFDDGHTLETSMAAGVSLAMARAYYVGQQFERPDGGARRAVAVEAIG